MVDVQRVQITVRGAVQGVGFRPFIYRLATEMGLPGWILNSSQGVFIEAEGVKPHLDAFLLRIEKEKPPRSFIQSLEFSFLDPVGFSGFEIRHSNGDGPPTALVLPDIAACPDCLRELFDPANRRYRYPFTNCTNCGPRFTIIESLPYDRSNTTMKKFEMCEACREEYENPLDRRFHAQPNACPVCGPHLELWDEAGRLLSKHHEALVGAAAAIRAGKIVAVKGLGGFHLIADARNEEAVTRMRERKHREEKPFALMVPSLESVKACCEVSELEERLLLSPESPIVLLRRKFEISNLKLQIAPSVAPRNPYLGVMLPYTPLHHVLMNELSFPVVATSGNDSDEPICTDEQEAVERLGGIADLFLIHDRPIIRHVDDSVVRIMMGRELVLRRARGYAPLPVHLRGPDFGELSRAAPSVLAVGGHLKNTVALTAGNNIFISQHIGDLETPEAFNAFRKVIASFQTLYNAQPERIACDLHPDYLSTQYAKDQGVPLIAVQHHYAHVASCMAENEIEGPVLGVSWDGTGYGPDGTIWGGEFLKTDASGFRRVASFRRFRLPGGAAAVKEPRRTAVGLLYEILGDRLFDRAGLPTTQAFAPAERAALRMMLAGGLNSPKTSSAGRLFDAVASLVGLRQRVSFEGQAAMELEFAIGDERMDEAYPFQISNLKFQMDDCLNIDWEPMISGILDDLKREISVGIISAKFHNTLAGIIVDVAKRAGEERIVLTGGCFQNKYLTERAVRELEAAGFRPYWHQRVPPNDGGIALGQAFVALRAAKAMTDFIGAQSSNTREGS
ncbi:MAG: carbamoyltransferase HypF [Nitrospirae bacterium]|nr:carbamoyltransferase HypF [Nitrospirota bacterium]